MTRRYQFKVLCCLLSILTFYPAFSKPPHEQASIRNKQNSINQVKVNLNEANAKRIAKKVKGIGLKRAEAIVAFRESHGPFKDLKSLSEVKGISKRFVKKHWSEIESVFRLE